MASRTVPYEGVEVLGGWAQAGQTTSVVRVWHTPGAMTLTQAVAPVPGWSGEVPHLSEARVGHHVPGRGGTPWPPRS